MKCIVLAGGTGDRLWPLSRKNYPKQFLNTGKHNSLFQECLTRNIPFCDEFIIVVNKEYQDIVDAQLLMFQGLSYQIVLEEKTMGTAPAVRLALDVIPEDTEVLIIPSDIFLNGDYYADSILSARKIADNDQIALFGVSPESPSSAYGYIITNGSPLKYVEKPSREKINEFWGSQGVYWNSGMILAKSKVLSHELESFLPKDMVERRSIERVVLEKSDLLAMVQLSCEWRDIRSLISIEEATERLSSGPSIAHNCDHTSIINEVEDQIIVANSVSDLMVVNTKDAIYISDRDHIDDIKGIVKTYSNEYRNYFEENKITYRPWGARETITQEKNYRIRKVTISPGKAMSKHSHALRTENYTVVQGCLSIEIDGVLQRIQVGDGIQVFPNQTHRLFNEMDEVLIIMEADTGKEITELDMYFHDKEVEELPSIYQLKPAFKDYLWGGTRLVSLYGKESPYDITAESWELSAHSAGQSVISDGPMKDLPFGEFVRDYRDQVCGWKSATFERFPILIKFIDALNPLSVQIHPYDDYAFAHENEFGKNEMWYVLDAKPDAFLYCGFNRDVTREEVDERIKSNTITEVLNKVSVKKGDCVFIPAGTIHAIGAGILICEIQQNSNSTYRVYDYDRRDKDGNLRELHIEKALDVMDFSKYEQGAYGFEAPRLKRLHEGSVIYQPLCSCKYFACSRHEVDGDEAIYLDEASFASLVFLDGEADITCNGEACRAKAGDSIFVSAGRKTLHVKGKCEYILTRI